MLADEVSAALGAALTAADDDLGGFVTVGDCVAVATQVVAGAAEDAVHVAVPRAAAAAAAAPSAAAPSVALLLVDVVIAAAAAAAAELPGAVRVVLGLDAAPHGAAPTAAPVPSCYYLQKLPHLEERRFSSVSYSLAPHRLCCLCLLPLLSYHCETSLFF